MHQETLEVRTRAAGLSNITAEVSAVVRRGQVLTGLCTVFVQHTSASLIIQENADPAVLRDLKRFMADLVPEDLALGWGPMSDNRILKTMDIAQSARFLTWHVRPDTPVSRDTIITHSANTHVIPADRSIQKQLAGVRVGEVVRLTGTLVDATRDDGAQIRTSLTRTDTGAGACEVMLVTDVTT